MLWLLEDALWPAVSTYQQHWMMSCFIWGLRVAVDAEDGVINLNMTGKRVKLCFTCDRLARQMSFPNKGAGERQTLARAAG